MQNKKQKIALLCVAVLLVFSIITGLVMPYLKNRDVETIDKNETQSDAVAVPNFQFLDEEGNVVEFDSFKGKPIVINFWGTWCPFCVLEMSDFNKIVGEYKDDVNFIFLDFANSEDETVEKVKTFIAENEYDNIVSYYDDPGYGVYIFGVNSFPTTVYVDKDGNLYDAEVGMTNYDDIKAVIDSMLK